MTDTIAVSLHLSAFVHQQGDYWEAVCPSLDVFSQGDSEEEAKKNLREAVELWVDSCIERNTLSVALHELGWHRVPEGWPRPDDTDSIRISKPDATDLGDPFSVEVTIPAYQAALFSGEASAPPC